LGEVLNFIVKIEEEGEWGEKG